MKMTWTMAMWSSPTRRCEIEPMHPHSYIPRVLIFAAFASVLLAATGAMAQDTVDVEVRVIQVSMKGGSHMDEALEDLEPRLLKAFEGYQSFRSIARHKATIAAGKTHSFPLPEGTTLQITPTDITAKDLRLGVKVGEMFRTKVRVSPGNTFFQAGLPYKGDILVIAITAR